jgi:hypothetical protein
MRSHLVGQIIGGLAVAVTLMLTAPTGAQAASRGQFCSGTLDVLCDQGRFCHSSGGPLCGWRFRRCLCCHSPILPLSNQTVVHRREQRDAKQNRMVRQKLESALVRKRRETRGVTPPTLSSPSNGATDTPVCILPKLC